MRTAYKVKQHTHTNVQTYTYMHALAENVYRFFSIQATTAEIYSENNSKQEIYTHTNTHTCMHIVVVVTKMMEWAAKRNSRFGYHPPAGAYICTRSLCVYMCVAMQWYSKCKAGACAQKGDSNRSCDCDSDGQYISLCPLPKCMLKLPTGALLQLLVKLCRRNCQKKVRPWSSSRGGGSTTTSLCCVAFGGVQTNENEMTNRANFKRRWWGEPQHEQRVWWERMRETVGSRVIECYCVWWTES